MINLNAAPTDGVAVVTPRAQSVAVSTAGVYDPASLARQQLAQAVGAPALIAAYASQVPQPPKPPARASTTVPSSPLAAQFIAQGAVASESDLEIFVPRNIAPATAEPAADDYLVNMRVARGAYEQAQAPAAAKPTSQPARAQAEPATEPAAQASAARAAGETVARSVANVAPATLPGVLTQFIRAPGLLNTRGFASYQLAEARNAQLRRAPVAAS